MVKTPFKIREKREMPWIKDWMRAKIIDGSLHLRLEVVAQINTIEEAQRVIQEYVDADMRERLQKALSVRRRRAKTHTRLVVKTELTREARNILLAVAKHKCVTTSDLIEEAFLGYYEKHCE